MGSQPEDAAWRAYSEEVGKAVRRAIADDRAVEACRDVLYAAPVGVSDVVPVRIINMLYEVPTNPDREDLAELNGVLRRLEAGATHDELVAYLQDQWG